MKTLKYALAASVALGAAVLSAQLLTSAAVAGSTPDWGATTTTTTPAGTKPAESLPTGLRQPQLAQLSCSVAQTPATMTFTITNVSNAETPKGTSQVTLCNMHQPNGPPAPKNDCGSIGAFPVPAIKSGSSYAINEPSPYVSTTRPTCQAASIVPD